MSLWKIAVLAGLLAMLAVVPSVAQSTMTGGPTTMQVKFTMPTAFYVQNTKLPAGAYTITQGGSGQSNMLLIRSDKPGHELFVEVTSISSPTNPPKHSEVTFSKYGNNDFLNEIWLTAPNASSAIGWQVLPSANEKAQVGTPTKHQAATK